MMPDLSSLSDTEVEHAQTICEQILAELKRVIIGQNSLLERLLVAVMGQGHILVEGMPGLAKTMALTTLGKVAGLSCQRIQFTPDLVPSDILGSRIFHPNTTSFTTEVGPIMAHLILADEINRAPAKVQSALLEAMQEGQVTLGKETFTLPKPFLVMATQNPLELDGTYPLPEAQLDRFMMHVEVDYPNADEELLLAERFCQQRDLGIDHTRPILTSADDWLTLIQATDRVLVAPEQLSMVVTWVRATRQHPDLLYGASPRAVLAILTAARAHALMQGRGFVRHEDLVTVAADCLRHRVALRFEAISQGLTVNSILTNLISGDRQPSVMA